MLTGDDRLPGEHLTHELETRLLQGGEKIHLLVSDAHLVDNTRDLHLEIIIYMNNNFFHLFSHTLSLIYTIQQSLGNKPGTKSRRF